MTATITHALRRQLADDLFASFSGDSDNYYIGIGRSEEWDSTDTTPTPIASVRQERNLRESLQSIIQTIDCSYVVPRNNWSSGTTYSAYDDNNATYPSNAYYVVTDDNNVYICLRQGKNTSGAAQPSTVQPTGVGTAAFETGDGYVWKFLYSIGTAEANRYLAANYMPVQFIDSASPIDTVRFQQYTVQNAADSGQISSIVVTNGGTGYSSATVSIQGGENFIDSARATATINSGVITKIEIDDSGGTLLMGRGYQSARVVITGSNTTPAAARAVISPPNGFGADPRDDLMCTAIMFNAKPNGTQNGDFIIGNDFRQVTILKNPKRYSTDSDFLELDGSALRKLKMQSIPNFTLNSTIQGVSSLAKAIVDYIDSDQVFIHQNETTGFGTFLDSETINVVTGSGDPSIVDSVIDPDIDIYSGEVLLVDNRAAVIRAADQTEDLKPIIQF